jgi:tryptophan synthase alpha chain
MNNRIDKLFETKKEKILSIFYTAGFPKLNDTMEIAIQLEKSGVDMIEIGIPFSDPIADGPTIQDSNKIALDNGMNLKLLIQQVKEIRKKVSMPIILMGYINPVMQYGFEQFVKDAKEAGADGFILPDLPLAEYQEHYQQIVEAHGLLNIFLISPTTSDERIRMIDQVSSGFIYAVSSSSTTGTKTGFSAEQELYFNRLKKMKLRNPFLIGFGVSNRETFNAVCHHSSGAIVGSAFIKLLKKSKDFNADIYHFTKPFQNN